MILVENSSIRLMRVMQGPLLFTILWAPQSHVLGLGTLMYTYIAIAIATMLTFEIFSWTG